jgi:glutathione S-transferase
MTTTPARARVRECPLATTSVLADRYLRAVRIWRIPLSTNVERVALALAHKGHTVEWVDTDPADRASVVEVSGQSRVPVLEDDDGSVITGSTTILEHLERRFPEPRLFPEEPLGAEVKLFVDWFERAWKPTAAAIEDELADRAPEPDKQRLALLRTRLARALDLFEGLLVDREFLLSERLTAADCVAFPFIKYAALGMPPNDEKLFHRILVDYQPLAQHHARVREWIARVDALPRA